MKNIEPTEIQHPNFLNSVYLEDGRIDCEMEHPSYGWIPTTISRIENEGFFDHIVATGDVAEYEPPAPPSHAQQRTEALYRVDQEHAGFLRALTGNATVEERDTWKTKEDAARALVGGTATDGQQAMIAYEAQGDGTEPLVLAQTIIAKAEAFQSLIGLAAGLKAKAKTAITQATNEQVPIEQVAPALEQVFGQISAETDAAIVNWKGQANDS